MTNPRKRNRRPVARRNLADHWTPRQIAFLSHPERSEGSRASSAFGSGKASIASADLVILTKRATRAVGRISDSFARAKPVPVLKSRSGPLFERNALEARDPSRAQDDSKNGFQAAWMLRPISTRSAIVRGSRPRSGATISTASAGIDSRSALSETSSRVFSAA